VLSTALKKLDYTNATARLIKFWEQLPRPKGQVCPKRSDFSTAQVNGTLPEIFVSEWVAPDELEIVQTGTVLDRLIGEDLTGAKIFEMTPAPLREAERAYYAALRDTPCAGMMTRSAPNRQGDHFYYRTLQLPLLGPYGEIRYFVGTGAVMNHDQLSLEIGNLRLGDLELVERHFFDIGAGLPPASIADTNKLGACQFHSLDK
jgi:hypothetical protein